MRIRLIAAALLGAFAGAGGALAANAAAPTLQIEAPDRVTVHELAAGAMTVTLQNSTSYEATLKIHLDSSRITVRLSGDVPCTTSSSGPDLTCKVKAQSHLDVPLRLGVFTGTAPGDVGQIRTYAWSGPQSNRTNATPANTALQVVAPPVADISAVATPGTTRMKVGETATFKATYRNRGPGAGKILASVPGAAGFEFAGWVNCGQLSGFSCTIGPLAAGKTATLSFRLKLTGKDPKEPLLGMTVQEASDRDLHDNTVTFGICVANTGRCTRAVPSTSASPRVKPSPSVSPSAVPATAVTPTPEAAPVAIVIASTRPLPVPAEHPLAAAHSTADDATGVALYALVGLLILGGAVSLARAGIPARHRAAS